MSVSTPSDPFIESLVLRITGGYKMPDGREVWIDNKTAYAIANRVAEVFKFYFFPVFR